MNEFVHPAKVTSNGFRVDYESRSTSIFLGMDSIVVRDYDGNTVLIPLGAAKQVATTLQLIAEHH